MADFVAHLHPADVNPQLLHAPQHLDGELMQSSTQLRQCQTLPGVRQKLLLRIGPPVAVVEVDHNLEARRLSPFGHGDHMGRIVVALGPALIGRELGVFARLVPHLEANAVDAIAFEDLQQILRRLGIMVIEGGTSGFELRQMRDIGADNRFSLRGWQHSGDQERHKGKCSNHHTWGLHKKMHQRKRGAHRLPLVLRVLTTRLQPEHRSSRCCRRSCR